MGKLSGSTLEGNTESRIGQRKNSNPGNPTGNSGDRMALSIVLKRSEVDVL